jgi:hypothetical protein
VNILGSRLLGNKIVGVPGRIALRRKSGVIIIAKDDGLLITAVSSGDGKYSSPDDLKLGEDLE